MEAKDNRKLTVILIFIFFCESNSSILSGLAGFGFSLVEHTVCDVNTTDSRTCYVSKVTNISCFVAEIRYDKCKKQSDSFLSNNSVSDRHVSNWTYLQAYYHRHNSSRHRPGHIGSCVELKPGNCTQYRCLKSCCNGWEEDETGQCNKPTISPCKNGGTYDVKTMQCLCLDGFSGYFCEKALCHRGCLHGGLCSPGADGANYCICPQYAYGSHCQYVRCPYTCENGGYCILDGSIPTCKCPPNIYGKTCAHSYYSDSTCPPPNTTLCTDLSCYDECENDKECSSGHVCCTDGCCKNCVKPKSPGCLHNGIVYEPSDWFRKDNCTECTCLHSGSIKCMTVPVSYDSSVCCFDYCQGKSTPKTPPSHRLPHIDCTDEARTVAINKFSAYAHMDKLNIEAKDENGSLLKVFYTPFTLKIPRVPVRLRYGEIISVSATDSFGQSVVCYQKVLVVDRTSPKFSSCPSDIYAGADERVSWRSPRAYDNLGIMSLRCSHNNHRQFPTGLNVVTCVATDYDDNKAFCTFNVHISDNVKSDRNPPRFLYCPHNIYATEGDMVFWKEPRAVDDVGIASFKSNHDSGAVFSTGLTIVIYTAVDHSNNKAHCTFKIFVTPKHTEDYSDTSEPHVTDSVKIIAGVVSSLVVILVVVFVMVVLYRRFRIKTPQGSRCRRHDNARARVPISTISNTLYNCGDETPGATIVPTLKPPPYSPATDPPAYEEVFSNPRNTSQSNVENYSSSTQPPAYDSIDQAT